MKKIFEAVLFYLVMFVLLMTLALSYPLLVSFVIVAGFVGATFEAIETARNNKKKD
jgi:hypothetical protein